jgi:hypothetical protein
VAAPSYGQSQIGPDGSFRMEGLAPGKARMGMQGFPNAPKGLSLVRTEVDGLDQREGIEVAAGAQITGVRLVFVYGTGSVRGELKIEGGSLPDGMQLQVVIRSPAGDARRFNRGAEMDGRLHFVSENIPPGNYELVVHGMMRPTSSNPPVPPVEYLKQTITVANSTEVKLALVVDVSAKKGSEQ